MKVWLLMVSFIPSYWTWLHTGTSRVSVNPLHFFMDGSMHRMGLLRDEAELYNKEVFCIGALQQLQLKWTKLWSRRVLKIYVVLCCFSLHLSISNWLFFFFFLHWHFCTFIPLKQNGKTSLSLTEHLENRCINDDKSCKIPQWEQLQKTVVISNVL